MTIGVPGFQGRRLTEARLARGLFKNALGDMIGVSGTAITRYEEGTDAPQDFRVDDIASKLNFPRDFFFKPAWAPPSIVHWRSRTSETKNAREMTEQRMNWLQEIFHFYEEYVAFPSVNLPQIDLPDDFRLLTGDVIEKAANEVRDHWNLGRHPIPDAILALENAGIPVVGLSIASEKQDGFCFYSDDLQRPFVGINSLHASSARARFDAAHELGHLVLHRNVTREQTNSTLYHKIIEDQAHRFAGAFLFPSESFFSEVRHTSLDYLVHLKRRWGISVGAMIFRAYSLDLLDDTEKSDLFTSMTRRRWRGKLREPFDSPDEMPLERPRMMRRAVEAILQEGIFSPDELIKEIALPCPEIESISGIDTGTLESTKTADLEVHLRRFSTTDLETGNVVRFPFSRK
jgi:Zn-dependent peptidase ImmA (M78 family)/transcriptional regulator with XRE-family HTH domain